MVFSLWSIREFTYEILFIFTMQIITQIGKSASFIISHVLSFWDQSEDVYTWRFIQRRTHTVTSGGGRRTTSDQPTEGGQKDRDFRMFISDLLLWHGLRIFIGFTTTCFIYDACLYHQPLIFPLPIAIATRSWLELLITRSPSRGQGSEKKPEESQASRKTERTQSVYQRLEE